MDGSMGNTHRDYYINLLPASSPRQGRRSELSTAEPVSGDLLRGRPEIGRLIYLGLRDHEPENCENSPERGEAECDPHAKNPVVTLG